MNQESDQHRRLQELAPLFGNFALSPDSPEHFRAIVQAIPLAVIVLDKDKQVTCWNPAAEHLLGWRAAEVLGRPNPLFAAPVPDNIRATVEQLLYSDVFSSMDMRCPRSDGTLIDVAISKTLLDAATGGCVLIVQDITERKQAEAASRANEGLFRALIENGSDVILVSNQDGFIRYASPSVERIMGYTPEEVTNTRSLDYIHTDDLPDATTWLQRSSQIKGVSGPFEARLRHKDSSWQYLEVVINNLLDMPGIHGLVMYIHDITERKRAEEELRQQNEYLIALHEITLALMNHLDVVELLETIVTYAGRLLGTPETYLYLVPSPDGPDVFGYGSAEKVRIYVPDCTQPGIGLTGQIWQTGQMIVVEDYLTWPHRTSNSKYDHLHATVGIPLKSGTQLIGVLCLGHSAKERTFSERELTLLGHFAELASVAIDNARLYTWAQQELIERTRVDAQLRELNTELDQRVRERTAVLQHQQSLLQAILDAMGEGVIYTTDTFTMRYVNAALMAMTGYTSQDLTDQPLSMIQGDDFWERLGPSFKRGGRTGPGATWRGEVRLRRKEGVLFDAALTITQVIRLDSESIGMVIIVRDVTAEKQLQTQKTRFIANASHELRTPLTNLKTRLYLARKQPDHFSEHLTFLERATDRMISLAEDLLDITRFEQRVIHLQRENVILQDLLLDIIEVQRVEAIQKQLNLDYAFPGEPLHLFIDAKSIQQVFTNLVVNAINYTPSPGEIWLYVSVETDGDTRWATITVQDTGIGIAPENLTRIFDPFFRVSEGSVRGTGLGLSIAREIVELHNGTLTVESIPGKGSTFRVKLPVEQLFPC